MDPKEVSKLDEPLSDKKELKIIEETSKVGGGTDETQALEETYEGLTLRANNVIKMIIMLTDGYGNRAAVNRIMQQVEDDNEVIFVAIGLGNEDNQGIVESYIKPLRDAERGNITGIVQEEPGDIIPQFLDFLRREVEKHRPAA